MSESINLKAPEPVISLTPPTKVEALSAKEVEASKSTMPITEELANKAKSKADEFVTKLLAAPVGTDAFRAQIDSAFSIGRKEIAASTTVTNRFTKERVSSFKDDPAAKALLDMREMFDKLRPPPHAELFSARKFLGIPLPFGDKLARYLGLFESAQSHMTTLTERLEGIKDDVAKDMIEISQVRQNVWQGLQKLEAAAQFMELVDKKLTESIAEMQDRDPIKARALESEVLYFVRQNLSDVRAGQALAINSYNVMEVLQKTGRETVNGLDRTLTMGMAALSLAVTLANATGRQMKAVEAIEGSKAMIEDLISQTGDNLGEHAKRVAAFSQNPVMGVQKLQEMFDKTFAALDTMDNYRVQALGTLATNNEMLKKQIDTVMSRAGAATNASQKASEAFSLDL